MKDSSTIGTVTLTGATVNLMGSISLSPSLSVFTLSITLLKDISQFPFNIDSRTLPLDVAFANYQDPSLLLMVAGVTVIVAVIGGSLALALALWSKE